MQEILPFVNQPHAHAYAVITFVAKPMKMVVVAIWKPIRWLLEAIFTPSPGQQYIEERRICAMRLIGPL